MHDSVLRKAGHFVSLLAAVMALIGSAAMAREYSPRVVSPHRADAYSMKTFRDFARWRNLTDDELAWEVYRYLIDIQSGVFHVNEVLEGSDGLSEFRTVRDPVKLLNVYGYGYCAILGPMMAGVWQDMGLGNARTVVLPGWGHVASEVYYGGGWHYLDLDVRAAFRRPDGRLASLEEARRDDSLWRDRGPLFFPNDPLGPTQQVYQRTEVHHYHGFHQSGHTMDFVLRQGESLRRWWQPKDGRWHHPAEWNRAEWLRRLIEQPPRGPKPNHRHFTVHNHANGRFVYEPDLTDKSSDFQDGVYQQQDVHSAADGLRRTGQGAAFATFEFRTPWIIVPLVGDLDRTDDDSDASVVEIDGQGLSVSLSLDGGLTWQEVRLAGLPASIDLTPRVSGTYGYLLRIALHDAQSVLRRLRVTTWVQVAPAALPCLGPGSNRMAYRIGDHYGLPTRVREICSQASHPETLLKHLVEPPADYDPQRQTARIRGAVTVKVEPPPGSRIAWFAAGASFRTHLHQAARNNKNSIAYGLAPDGDFFEIYRADVPTDTEHWHYNACREVRLEDPANAVYVRYVGDPALNNVQIHAHCLDDYRRSDSPVVITHAWTEGDASRTATVRLQEPGEYEVMAGAEPRNDWIEIAVPSASAVGVTSCDNP
ncbi:MAG: hypothetical protein KJ000_21290 [Pirellulaceae bacterium]|nr:hypothetical protein [Pirellulaceae bacterium]